jgi:hypothetical protein
MINKQRFKNEILFTYLMDKFLYNATTSQKLWLRHWMLGEFQDLLHNFLLQAHSLDTWHGGSGSSTQL